MELKKILRNPNTYIWLGSAVVVTGLILVLVHKKKSVEVIPGGAPASEAVKSSVSPKVVTGGVPVMITNFDSAWDYKLEKGVWYTKKKTTSVWSKMKDVASDYTAAVAKLTAFLNK